MSDRGDLEHEVIKAHSTAHLQQACEMAKKKEEVQFSGHVDALLDR